MTAFRVGQRVVCVNPVDDLKPKQVYTISAMYGPYLGVRGSVFGDNTAAYYVHRFRPIVSRPTSIAVFQAMLTGKKAGVEA